MEMLLISGGQPLKGEVEISGSKNVALKAIVAGLLTEDELVLENVPDISDLTLMEQIAQKLGVKIERKNKTLTVRAANLTSDKVPLEMGALLRTSSMFIAPLIARLGRAVVPNPGGCRIGARPIDRHIQGLKKMGLALKYNDRDGYFHAESKKLKGVRYRFPKNTHTGTETLTLAAVLAEGQTVLENAAHEPEVDDLIRLLNSMGGKIRRTRTRTIVVEGVKKLHGTTFKIMPDRNEAVTFAVAALATGGDVFLKNAQADVLKPFLRKVKEAGGEFKEIDTGLRFFPNGKPHPTNITTSAYPGFMTDWQAPWALFMTQADGESLIHETIYENRFQYTEELKKMGAKIILFNPKISNPKKYYNFNWEDNRPDYFHAAQILGPTKLHNAVLQISDLRAGATLVLAALTASGKSYLTGVEHLDRGYENFEKRLRSLGAKIKRVEE
ncbi:MAG: UDP-N-acetylglucosamine 1-carboxyvinyltransferase [bacterium]|nr:UDP-N-acetylglucosamine 1-carboxyvinyltransferase [bacterium]